MKDLIETSGYKHEQAFRMRRMFSAVVLSLLDEWIKEANKYGIGYAQTMCRLWANSEDGEIILNAAGIEPCSRTTEALEHFIIIGEPTSVALAGEAR